MGVGGYARLMPVIVITNWLGWMVGPKVGQNSMSGLFLTNDLLTTRMLVA